MFEESYNNYYYNPMWRGVPMYPEIPMRPFPYFYDNDNSNQKAMSPTPAVMNKPNKVIPQPYKVMPQSNKVMQEPGKAMPQVQADYQNTQISPTTPIVNNPLYNQGWLKTQIGKFISIDFLIGNMYIDRQGVLQDVGISYIVIKESGTHDIVMCDIYSIKFVTVFGDQASKCRV